MELILWRWIHWQHISFDEIGAGNYTSDTKKSTFIWDMKTKKQIKYVVCYHADVDMIFTYNDTEEYQQF